MPDTPASCPWCKSTNPDLVGVDDKTGKVCRDPFHCPVPEGHGNPWRMCPYCDWREDPLIEPPAGWAVGWVPRPDPGPLTEDELRVAVEHGQIRHDASTGERSNLWGLFAARAAAELLEARKTIRRVEGLTREAERHLGNVRATQLRAVLEGRSDA
ncbi:hypothetical protein [Nocardia wallacei]|uniref:hypothetical protein n=1 Tax=Nocardia wallacei TaxID=480035 RepID=UPI0024551FC3|nr:hypothetical protein [Nocardia wallacei]